MPNSGACSVGCCARQPRLRAPLKELAKLHAEGELSDEESPSLQYAIDKLITRHNALTIVIHSRTAAMLYVLHNYALATAMSM